MAQGGLTAIHALTKDLAGPVRGAIADLDERCEDAVDRLCSDFDNTRSAITAIADAYEAKAEELIEALEKVAAELNARATLFETAKDRYQLGLAGMFGTLDGDAATIGADATALGKNLDALDAEGVQLHGMLNDESTQTVNALEAHRKTAGSMIDQAQAALDAFASNGANQLAAADAALAGLDDTAMTLLDQTAEMLGNRGQQGFKLLSGEARQVAGQVLERGAQVMNVAHQVLDQTGILRDEFTGAVDRVADILESLTALVEALGPLVELADQI